MVLGVLRDVSGSLPRIQGKGRGLGVWKGNHSVADCKQYTLWTSAHSDSTGA